MTGGEQRLSASLITVLTPHKSLVYVSQYKQKNPVQFSRKAVYQVGTPPNGLCLIKVPARSEINMRPRGLHSCTAVCDLTLSTHRIRYVNKGLGCQANPKIGRW